MRQSKPKILAIDTALNNGEQHRTKMNCSNVAAALREDLLHPHRSFNITKLSGMLLFAMLDLEQIHLQLFGNRDRQ
jgi:hypothetical protein